MAAPVQGMNNLVTLIKRLEAATSRLEDIASSAKGFDSTAGESSLASVSHQGQSSSAPELPTIPPVNAAAPPPAEPLPQAIVDLDAFADNEVQAFVDHSKSIDPLVAQQADAVSKVFADQRRFLLISTRAKRPDETSKTFADLLKDLTEDMGTVSELRERNRGSQFKEHLSMVAEGITALQWLITQHKPADFVGEIIGGAQMYGNRVLKTYKDGDQAHIKYVRAYYALLQALQAYIRNHYPTGVSWNPKGVDAAQAMKDLDAPSSQVNGHGPPSAGGPPPPPPPPPLPNFDNVPPPPPGPAPKGSSSAGGDMGAVFEQLNRGSAVTAGLKKVDPSQMTHKNASLRASSTVPAKADDISRSRSPGPEIKPKPQSMRQNSSTVSSTTTVAAKSPKKELDGNKWIIENFDSPSEPIEVEVSLSHSIQISNCKKTTIVLKGKANAVSISSSPRLQILVDTLISSVDVVGSDNFAIQITGTLPNIQLDSVDGASIYLSEQSLGLEVLTSKCSSINIVLPPEAESDGDAKECPIPDQIRTVIEGRKAVSSIVEHAG